MVAPAKPRLDLRWELLPLFLIILSFALGFIFYGGRIQPLDQTGQEQYGPEWPSVFGIVQWGIPSAALGVYLFLSLGMWGVGKVKDPLSDWNAVARAVGRGVVDDPARKERLRTAMIRGQYLCKIGLAVLALFAQWRFFEMVGSRIGLYAP